MNTNERPALVIMAAGMGSRFGGMKQLTPVGPSGEFIIDYSIHDALTAGFSRIVFIIKRENEALFREKIGDRVARRADVSYVYQDTAILPEGVPASLGEQREKPWGTGHAVMCCREAVKEPFVVINADDYYGSRCFRLLYDFLTGPHPADGRFHLAMAGFVLKNTLTENGSVSRGVCSLDEEGYLTDIVERTRIEKRPDGAAFTEDGGETWTSLSPECTVSMNCWAFPAGTLPRFEALFRDFLKEPGKDLKRAEFYLPYVVDRLVAGGEADVRVLSTPDCWYGMTYREDQEKVVSAIRAMVDKGQYPVSLWG